MHHERMDGSGYPLGILEKDIPICARIISVADVFDAMTSDRIYKKAVTPFKAFEMFVVEGMRLFDTTVLFTLLEKLSCYYIGMKVILDNGEIGEIVYIPPKNVLSPVVKVNNEFVDFSKENIFRIVNIL
jgi:HD-GYP domain-containing protein (c-di-GMP phosphodiesterase class II)